MAICGIICEYNPFHLGHEKQFHLIRKELGADTPIVCLMSGNFVQRGMPAVFDKTVRARAAVECGASLVLELPVTAALSSAEGFAQGSVEILDWLGVVDTLCFGSESGDCDRILRTAQTLLCPEYTAALRTILQGGTSYPAARQAALEACSQDGSVLRTPNDILGVEYCKALIERGSAIQPFAVQREGDYHSTSADAENPSATSIRTLLECSGNWKDFVPPTAAVIYDSAVQHRLQYGERAVLARLRAMEPEQWQTVPFGSEGLWSKVYKAAQTAPSLEEILTRAKSKRYPRTRLQRLVLCAYLGISEERLRTPAPYVRVLAFDEKGQMLLRQIRRQSDISILHAGEKGSDAAFYALERRCAGLYGLFSEPGEDTTRCLEENIRIFKKKK